jgi:hypothetical protein
MSTRKNLNPEFDKEANNPMPKTPKKYGLYVSTKITDEKIDKFKEQIKNDIGPIDSIESIKRVEGNNTLIVVCLTIGTCMLYQYLHP